MTSQIWKYPVPTQDAFIVAMPLGSTFLHLGVQRGEVFMWVQVDPEAKRSNCHFAMIGTGHEFEPVSDWLYSGTVMLMNDALVWHLYRMQGEL